MKLDVCVKNKILHCFKTIFKNFIVNEHHSFRVVIKSRGLGIFPGY